MGLDYTDEPWVRKMQNDYTDCKQRSAQLESENDELKRQLEQARQAILTGHDLAAVADALGVKAEAKS